MNVLRLLSVAVCLCVAPGARVDDDLKRNQTASRSVCVLECSIADATTVAKTFFRLVSEERARVIHLSIDTQTENSSNNSFCNNSTVRKSTQFNPTWATDEREPYLPLSSYFIGKFFISPVQSRWRMRIYLNCSATAREYQLENIVPDTLNETSLLENAVAKRLIRNLVREKGVLCFPWESHSDGGIFYKCCHFNKLTTGITCNLVQSTIDGWIQALLGSWLFGSIIIFQYLPAVICLFPSLPRVSRDGIPCIALEDPSPAALQSLIAKAFARPNVVPRRDVARLFFMKSLTSCILLVVALNALGLNLSNYRVSIAFGVLMAFSTVDNIFDLRMPRTQPATCPGCGQSPGHSNASDAIKEHMNEQLLITSSRCHKLSTDIMSRICFRPSFKSVTTAIRSVCRIFMSTVLFPFAITGLLIGGGCLILRELIRLSPFPTIAMFKIYLFRERIQILLARNHSWKVVVWYFVINFLKIWNVLQISLAELTLLVIGLRVGYLVIAAIDFADIVVPLLALSVLILYHLYNCYSSSSEKYQILKVKLFEGIKEYHENGGRLLLVFTEKEATAIPEDLFKGACKNLGISMRKTFWQGFMKMICLTTFTITVYASIQIFGSRTGTAPLTKVVALFMAGSLPKVFSVLSAGGNQDKLQELDMEVRLKDFIATYANLPQVTVKRESQNDLVYLESTV